MEWLSKFMDAMQAVREAEEALRKCQDACDHDAGYFCRSEESELDEARARAELAFANAVREVAGPMLRDRDSDY